MSLQHVGTVPFEATIYDYVSDKYTARHFVTLVALKVHLHCKTQVSNKANVTARSDCF